MSGGRVHRLVRPSVLAIAALVAVGGLALTFVAVDAAPAAADNCSGWTDCNGALSAALLALLGLALLVAGLAGIAGVVAAPTLGLGTVGWAGIVGIGVGVGYLGGSEVLGAMDAAATQRHLDEHGDNYAAEADREGNRDAYDHLVATRAAGMMPDGPDGWLQFINPNRDDNNCPQTADAVEQTLAGHPRVADDGSGRPRELIERAYGSSTETTPQQILDWLNGGEGRRGLIIIEGPHAQHVFNGANIPGRGGMFLDGQTGHTGTTLGDITGSRAERWPEGEVHWRFIPTNPRTFP